jgi:hypothetical protein
MAIEAPISKFKKNNLKIYIALCIGLAAWCAYDGHFNEDWIKEHTNPDNTPKPYLVFNQKAPYFFGGAAVLLGAYLFAIRNRKIIVDENELVINDKEKISLDSIQKIDKTRFKSKGLFLITYKNQTGRKVNRKLSDRNYDNLGAVLDKLVAKIS